MLDLRVEEWLKDFSTVESTYGGIFVMSMHIMDVWFASNIDVLLSMHMMDFESRFLLISWRYTRS